jgi:polyferredoxin
MFTWKRVRYAVMFGFLAFITWVGYRHQVLGGGPAGVPTVDALCPLGGLESIYSYLSSGTWLRRVAPSALVLFAAVVGITLLFGRVFCGWICPLGTIGEISGGLARKLGIKRKELPQSLDRALKMLKYAILAVILYYTWSLALAWRDYDPWAAWMHLAAAGTRSSPPHGPSPSSSAWSSAQGSSSSGSGAAISAPSAPPWPSSRN